MAAWESWALQGHSHGHRGTCSLAPFEIYLS